MKKKEYDSVTSVRMPMSMKKAVIKRAEKEQRSFSKMLLILVNEALERKQ